MSDEMPLGWVPILLDELVSARKGKKPNITQPEPSRRFVPYLDIHAIERGVFREYAEVASSRVATTADVLVVWDGARSGWAGLGRDGAIGSTIMALQPKTGDRLYIYRWLQSQFEHVNSNTRGTGIPHVDPEVFWNLTVPLAPLAEQRRIVAKLEQVLGKVEACQRRLEKIPTLLKRFRQSVLAAACSGRLTAGWREANTNAEPYACDTIETDEEVPANWRATSLGRLTSLVTSGSRGWAKYYAESGSTFIRAQNINADYLNLDDIAYVRPPEGAEGFRTRVRQHDLLVTITGANVTKSALVERPIKDAYISQHVALARLQDIRLSKFVFHALVCPSHGRKQLLAAAYGQGKPGLNLENIRDVVVVLPPLSEQQEIVRRVEALFALADKIEARYAKAQAQVDRLTPSLLARAFAGKLVPQDPADEPAAVLLERLRAGKGTATSAGPTKENKYPEPEPRELRVAEPRGRKRRRG
ncbi:MAG: restriction endonuclease subunit S [Candidatus Didemnitutus sp.]|nr:restriction endonuclease subunit S [Candidatus Didemnitutus sp.]